MSGTPEKNSSAAHSASSSVVCPTSGCISRMARAGTISRKVMTGLGSFIGLRSAMIAAASTAKPGLRNSDGWSENRPSSIERAGAEDLVAGDQHQAGADQRHREHDGGGDLELLQRQQRCAAQDGGGDDREQDLLGGVAEIAGGERAAGRGRAGGEGEHQADGDQHQHQHQRNPVDGPPPGGIGAAVGARVHDASRTGWALRSATAARKASPRASKSLNWSNEAQAGDSSTTGAATPAFAASSRRRARPAPAWRRFRS
ncbi:MAG: hypothetical protein WDN08_13810 [Rhizomicrobium sp.]